VRISDFLLKSSRFFSARRYRNAAPSRIWCAPLLGKQGKGCSMRGVRTIVAAAALMVSPALAADEVLPLSTMTCKQFVDAPKDSIGVILTWMMGYLQDSDEPAEINFTKMEDLGKKLKTYCDKNPSHAVMTALDKVTDEDSK
jgi:acid stress chaperone HdeB